MTNKYSKREIAKASTLIAFIFISVFIIGKSLGDSKMKAFKSNGKKAIATITNKNTFKNYRKGATTTEYLLTLGFVANNKLTYSQLSVDKDMYHAKAIKDKIEIYYLKNNPQKIELQTLVDKK